MSVYTRAGRIGEEVRDEKGFKDWEVSLLILFLQPLLFLEGLAVFLSCSVGVWKAGWNWTNDCDRRYSNR